MGNPLTDRELDAAVARALGWTEVPDGYGGTSLADAHGHLTGFFTASSLGSRSNRYRPSKDGNHMLSLLGALRERGMRVTLSCVTEGAWECYVDGRQWRSMIAVAPTLPRAVAEAAVLALESEE